jgi:steroid delta-isomerase-like uncharacterized protein
VNDQDRIKFVEEHLNAYSAGDWERYKAGAAPDIIYEEKATGARVQGPDQVIAAVKAWKVAFPDLKATITKTYACGNTVVAELVWEGTHTGSFAGPLGTIPPTGKFGTVPAVEIVTFENDKAKEVRHYFDLMTVLRNMGAVPTLAAAR